MSILFLYILILGGPSLGGTVFNCARSVMPDLPARVIAWAIFIAFEILMLLGLIAHIRFAGRRWRKRRRRLIAMQPKQG